ncbi:hypothetical protein D3C71_1643520 [compost metagenome]
MNDGLRRGDGGRIDIGTEELPAIVAVTDQRIHAVGAHADVQHLHGGATGDHTVIATGQQVGEEVHVIGAAWHRWAQVVGRNVPVSDAIERLEQRPVEHPHGFRAGEVDAFLAVRIDDHELLQFRRAFDQRRKVVATLMAIARVQAGLFLRGDGRGRGLRGRLFARRLGGAGGGHGGGRFGYG